MRTIFSGPRRGRNKFNQTHIMNTRTSRWLPFLVVFTAILFESLEIRAAEPLQDKVDFRYSPPEWQAAICLPDDPQKSLVDKSGELLYHFQQGGREFGARIGIEVVTNAVWQKQELHSPRVPIVKTFHSAPGLEIVQEAFALTALTNASRNDLILVKVANTGKEARVLSPKLVVDTGLKFHLDGQRIVMENGEAIISSLKITRAAEEKFVPLEAVTVSVGQSASFFVMYCAGKKILTEPATLAEAQAARNDAVKYWEHAPLPYGLIQIPDAGVQALVDSSIRNIWQAREIKNGHIAFQVGPTCYRGLWIVDGAFLLEAATMLGAGDQARDGVAYELTHQKPDGRIEVMKDYWKENGIVLWTCVRHAQLTQDKAWLESVWPKLERIAQFIKTLRAQTLNNDSPLDDGLMPRGFPDGGIGGVHDEYTNPYWNLLGLRSFIEAARWLGKADEAAAWQKEYDDFMAAFARAEKRDLSADSHGHAYLPILMGEAGKRNRPNGRNGLSATPCIPARFSHRTIRSWPATWRCSQPPSARAWSDGTGWDATGIWNYFASFYAHAWLWQGNGRKAAEILYAYANHAAPVLDWREEQSLKGEPFKKVGDMPHNWASAEFIRLTVHLLELDRGDELHLLEGLPVEWTKPGMVTKLNGICTPFGKLTMELRIAEDGKSAKLHIGPLSDSSCRKVVVHLSGWASADSHADLELDPKKPNDRSLAIAPDASAKGPQK